MAWGHDTRADGRRWATGLKVTLRDVPQRWATCTPFDCNGTLTGLDGGGHGTGRLNQEDSRLYRQLSDAGKIRYTVKSYNTVVAFVTTDGQEWWTNERFSVTTSKHMGKLYSPYGYGERERFSAEEAHV